MTRVTHQNYTGNQQYAGHGNTRSCGRCAQHKPYTATACKEAVRGCHTKRWGWICADCNAAVMSGVKG